MQVSLALPSHLPTLRDRLRALLGPQVAPVRLDPVSQLIHAVLSARTYEEVSWAAFMRLRAAMADWTRLAEADVGEVEQIIDPVTFADRKARQLPVLVRVLLLRRAEHDRDAQPLRAHERQVARGIAKALLLLVGGVVFLVDDDQAGSRGGWAWWAAATPRRRICG